MTDQTPAEQLRATAARLREALGVKPVARHVERTFVAVCTNHDAGTLLCFNCAYFDAEDETLAALIVSLLNARLPLADWLQEVADDAAKFAEGFANSADEVATGCPLAVARALK